MNSPEPESNLDPQLKKLEYHIRHLPTPSLPLAWKQDILSAALDTENKLTTPNDAAPQRLNRSVWLSILNEAFKLITPVRATVAVIWLMALCGSRFDTWLNGSANSVTNSTHPATPYTSLSDQLKQWELAGLDPVIPEKEPSSTKHPETLPGPRSQRKLHSPFTIHHS